MGMSPKKQFLLDNISDHCYNLFIRVKEVMGNFTKTKKGKEEEWSWEESQATKDALAKYWARS